MTTRTRTSNTPEAAVRPRRVVRRTRGRPHGPIVRLVSPSDIGELIKPFVFLDYFEAEPKHAPTFGFHPHSGIATLTVLLNGQVSYEETTGVKGVMESGGIEWMRAGGGVWHAGSMIGTKLVNGFQLWVALPPDHELGPVESVYQAPDKVSQDGPARVLIGAHGGAASVLEAPASMNYLAVRLKAGASWRYQPPAAHTVAWMALGKGSLATPERVEAGELVIFEPANTAIDFFAEVDTEFVLGSAVAHPHDLVTGYYSVRTSQASLEAGERRIEELQSRLQAEGRL